MDLFAEFAMPTNNPIVISEYICGGYFIARLAPREDRWMDRELLPAKVLSASRCICAMVPDDWAIHGSGRDKEARQQAAALFKIPSGRIYDLVQRATMHVNEGQMGWPNVFYSLEVARAFARQFVPPHPDVRLCGLGLPKKMVGRFLEEAEPNGPGGQPAGVYRAIAQGRVLDASGEVLGFELLGFNGHSLHSWICNGLPRPIVQKLKIGLTGLGLIDGADGAEKAAEHCRQEKSGAEPGWWAGWLLVQYGL